MQVTVRLYASLRDRAGGEYFQIQLPDQATVAILLERVAAQFPSLEESISTVVVAVNQEFAFAPDHLREGDEIVLFPPVSGGAGSNDLPEYLAVTTETLDVNQIIKTITISETGAVCVFSGAVRGRTMRNGQSAETDRLMYEAYQPMAEQKLRQVAREIRSQFPGVQGIGIVQRIGTLLVGETTILVACSSAHRAAGCFEAARYGIDRVKEIVPVWKKEVGPDRQEWVDGHYLPTPTDTNESSGTQSGRLPVQKTWQVSCAACGNRYPLEVTRCHCDCGGLLVVADGPNFDRHSIDTNRHSLWRYREIVAPPHVDELTLGEGWTPLITAKIAGRLVYLKMESLNPTGSFKDRGASLMTAWLKAQGVRTVHDDSSGNAGAALAAYAAYGGLQARLFVPSTASPVKLAQIALYGAELVTIPGPRSAAADAASAMRPEESFYASHVGNPVSILAYRTIAYELWEQLNGQVPDVIILPVGHGTQLLGISHGFGDLHNVGLTASIPRLIGVQAEQCAPIWQHWAFRAKTTSTHAETPTLAEGIRIDVPLRTDSVVEAVRASEGEIVTVGEGEIIDGLHDLAHCGILVEPTSAVVVGGLRKVADSLPREAVVVLSITGSGHKTPNLDKLAESSAFSREQ